MLWGVKNMKGEKQEKTASDELAVPIQDEITISREEYEKLQNWAIQGQKKQSSFWTDALINPEGTRALKDAAKEVIESAMGSWAKLQRGILFYSGIRMVLVVVLLSSIVVVASWLTSIGRLDSSSFIFLLGILIGYLLTFLTKVELLK
jgi:hypothetical protein